MRYPPLDTHVFLWYILNDPKLKDHWRVELRVPANKIFVSVVSVWEACIKYQLGKLPLPANPAVLFPAQRAAHHMDALVLDEGSLVHLAGLPSVHKYPFDRMLICQAIEHGCRLVTDDTSVLA